VTLRLRDGAEEERHVLANPHLDDEGRAKGIKVAEWLVEQGADVIFLKESLKGKGPNYVFGDAAVEMRQTEVATLDEALDEARAEDGR